MPPVNPLISPFPQISTRFVDESGKINHTWLNLLQALWYRTGQAQGTVSFSLDTIGNVQGDILYRGATVWQALPPGVLGQVLKTGGPSANPSWDDTGTVTEIDTGLGLTGGPIVGSGTISFAEMDAHTIWANLTGAAAEPSMATIEEILDQIGATQGQILYRGAAEWDPLAVGTARQVLMTGGAAANPSWNWPNRVATGLVAAGTNQGNALVLTTEWAEIATVAAATGVKLIPTVAGSEPLVVVNNGANNLNIYPAVGTQIDALGANNPYVLAPAAQRVFRAFTATQFYSGP